MVDMVGQSSGQDCENVQQSDLIMSDIVMVRRRCWVMVDMVGQSSGQDCENVQ